jgi:hypothetical protein
MYGINNIQDFNEDNYEYYITKYKNYKYFHFIVSDSTQYHKFINNGINNKQRNDLGQPVQILYFDSLKIKSYHINCYAKGRFSNINWNTDNRFSSFIPQSALPLDSINISLNTLHEIYKEINLKNKRYNIVIFWNLMFENISNSAIETVINNINEFNKNKDIDVYMINSDKFFLSLNKSP